MGNGVIELSDKDIEVFKKTFNDYILKIFQLMVIKLCFGHLMASILIELEPMLI